MFAFSSFNIWSRVFSTKGKIAPIRTYINDSVE